MVSIVKKYAAFSVILAILSFYSVSDEYRFASINHLVEQEIGRIVLPQIYARLGITISTVPLPGKRAQHDAASGKLDGEVMRIYSYGDETPSTIRVPTPYYYLETMAFVRRDTNIEILTKEDLQKYKLAKVRGVKHTNNITYGLENVKDVASTTDMMKLISSGFVDVGLTNTVDGLVTIKRMGLEDITPMKSPLATLDLYHYVHVSNADLIPLIDDQIRELKESGELESMLIQAEKHVIDVGPIIVSHP